MIFQLLDLQGLPSGKLPHHNYGKSQIFMGKLTINGDFPVRCVAVYQAGYPNESECDLVRMIHIWNIWALYMILLGGLEHCFFYIIYGIILPIDFHFFQDG